MREKIRRKFGHRCVRGKEKRDKGVNKFQRDKGGIGIIKGSAKLEIINSESFRIFKLKF